MTVYILFGAYSHEGDNIIGIYYSENDAKKAMADEELLKTEFDKWRDGGYEGVIPSSSNYDLFSIEEHEVR